MERIVEEDSRDNQKKTTSDWRMERIEEGGSGFIHSILQSGVGHQVEGRLKIIE